MDPRGLDALEGRVRARQGGPREHLEELRAETEHIGAYVERRRARHFGREIDRFAFAHHAVRDEDPRGQAEDAYRHFPVPRDLDELRQEKAVGAAK